MADEPLAGLVRAFGPGGAPVGLDEMLEDLAPADVVFLGETHLDDVTHRVELAVLEGLAERRGGRVVLALEMFATDAQDTLDAYLAGRIDEGGVLAGSRPWKNYTTGYRALVESARGRGLPVRGSNIPDELRRRISAGGPEAFQSLGVDERALVPPELLPNGAEYWQRFDRASAGHMGGATTPPRPGDEERLYSAQSLWDNTMGWSCAEALRLHPGHLVLHVSGGFHTKYGQGTVEQLRRRRPDARIATVSVIPASDLTALDIRDAGTAADYLVFAQRRARGLQEGFHAVDVAREVRYRLHLPAGVSASSRAPLLVWLPPEGFRAADDEPFWRAALGDEAALAIVEPPGLEREDDLHLGGRWYREETFHDDVSALIQALERIVEYAGRHHPVDASRVAVGGAGTAGTVVVAAAFGSDRLKARAVAVAPRRTSRLIELSLPDLPPPCPGLTVLVGEARRREWEGRSSAYRSAGLEAGVVALEGDAYLGAERVLREALGLAPPPRPSGPGVALVPAVDSPLAHHWARVLARRLEREGTAAAVLARAEPAGAGGAPPAGVAGTRALAFPGEWPPDSAPPPPGATFLSVEHFADARTIPLAAGPFGGTTVIVVPATAPEPERAGWRALESGGAMQKAHGRFHRLAVAFEGASPGLPEVLAAIEGAGRSNVLVVPAAFCADAALMSRLRGQVSAHEPRMTIAWLPGLGGTLTEAPP